MAAEKKAEADAAKAAKLAVAYKPTTVPAPAPAAPAPTPSGPSGGQVLPKEEISPETLALLKSLKKS